MVHPDPDGARPPGGDPGLVTVSVREARRLATAPVIRAARDLRMSAGELALPGSRVRSQALLI